MYPQGEIISFSLTLVFQNQPNRRAKSLTLPVPYYGDSRKVKINQAFQIAYRKGFLPHSAQIFYADHANQMNVFLGIFPFAQDIKIQTDSLKNCSLFVNYRKIRAHEGMSDENSQPEMNQDKKLKKTKERTIGEAVKAVKIWRELYETVGDNWKRKYTLEEAAREIGMAKKTLDDYNNHIRMAIENKFNFEKYENSKIGVLRKFIKLVKRGDEEIAMEQYVIDNDIDKYWIDFN